MGAAAAAFWAGNGDREVTKEQALAVLDAAGERFRRADAEFDDETQPNEPLGRLLAIAFGPWSAADDAADPSGEQWYERIERPFRARYQFT